MTDQPNDRCAWCDGPFERKTRVQRCCSHSCSVRLYQREHPRNRKHRRDHWRGENYITPDNALLMCDLDHEHRVGRRQMHLVGTLCPWCRLPLAVVQLGWEGAA
jgi:hypothetical protein